MLLGLTRAIVVTGPHGWRRCAHGEAGCEAMLPHLRQGMAVDPSLTPSSWNAFSRDLLPALVAADDGGQLAPKLTAFYHQMELTQWMQRTLVVERRRAIGPVRFLARKAHAPIIETVEDVLREADELVPLVQAQMISWRDQATELRS